MTLKLAINLKMIRKVYSLVIISLCGTTKKNLPLMKKKFKGMMREKTKILFRLHPTNHNSAYNGYRNWLFYCKCYVLSLTISYNCLLILKNTISIPFLWLMKMKQSKSFKKANFWNFEPLEEGIILNFFSRPQAACNGTKNQNISKGCAYMCIQMYIGLLDSTLFYKIFDIFKSANI